MFWIISWLLAAFLFWLSYVFFRKWFDELDDSYAFMLNALIWVLIWIPFSLYMWVDFQAVLSGWDLWFWAFWSAILSEAFVLYALAQWKISITWTVFSIYPLFTAVISLFVNNEVLTLYQGGAIVLVIIGISLISREWITSSDLKEKSLILKSISIALLAAFFVGIADSYGKFTLELYWFTTFLFCLWIAQPIVAYGNMKMRGLWLKNFHEIIWNHEYTKWLGIGSILNIVWLIFFRYAFDYLFAWVASALTWIYPAIMVIFAYLFLKETINTRQYIWIWIVFLTVYLFSIYLI